MTVGLFPLTPIKYSSILLSVAIAGGLYVLLLGFRLLARQRSLLTIPAAKIRSAARGLIQVSGVADGPCATMAPITGEPCFLYQATAWRQHENKKNQWEKVADEMVHVPFFIDDANGELLIEALGADLELHPRFRGEYDALLLRRGEVPPGVSDFLSRHGVALDRNLLIEERLIKAGDALFVAGTLTENPNVEVGLLSPHRNDPSQDRSGVRDGTRDGFRDSFHSSLHNDVRSNYRHNPAQSNLSEQIPAPEIIRLAYDSPPSSTREMSQQAKIAAALTRAGMSGPQIWSTAEHPRQTLAVEEVELTPTFSPRTEVRLPEVHLRKDRPNGDRPREPRSGGKLGSSDFNLTPPVVLMKGAKDPTFVISFRSQKEIVSATAWKAVAMVCAGTVITLFGLCLLWTQMALL